MIRLDKKYLLIFLISFLVQFLLALTDSPILLWDENAYLATAKKILGISKYSEEFRFPLLYWLLVPLIYLFGENILIIKSFLILVYSLSMVILFKLFEEFYPNSWKNHIFILFLILNGLIIFWGHRIYPDILAMSFLIFSIYFYYRFLESKTKRDLILLSLFSVLTFLTKFYYAIFNLVIFFFLNKKNKIKYLTYSFLLLLPWLLYNLIFYGNPLWNFIEQLKAIYFWQHYEPISKFLENIINYLGFLIMPLFFYKLLSKKEKPLYFYTVLMLLYLCLFVKMKDLRYLITILPALIILGRATIDKIPSTMLILFLLYGFSTGYSFFKGISEIVKYNLCWDGTDVISFSIHYLREYNATRVLSNCCWVWIANYLNIEAYSLWNKNVSYLIKLYGPDYIVYSPTFGIKEEFDFNGLEEVIEYEDKCGNTVIIYKV